MESESKYHDLEKEIYLFINSSSGGGVGKEMIDRKLSEQIFEVRKTQHPRDETNLVKVVIHFFNMKDPESKKAGFSRLKKATDQNKPVILVICGGDGTVMWIVTEMSDYHIDHSKVPMAIIPLGTGNDFSQNLGWGKQVPDLLANNYDKLKKRITYWLSAEEEKLDIWMVQAEVQQYGKFEKVENSENKVIEGRKYTKHFCNYFSVGVDGKIGYSFDMHRTGSRMGNLAVYGMMGLVKSMTKTKSLGQLTQSMRQSVNRSSDIVQMNQNGKLEPIAQQAEGESNITSKVVFEAGTKNMKEIEDNQNLLALNINSFMGGIKDVWRNSKVKQYLKDQKFTDQRHDDGKIEFISFGGAFSMGMQKTAGGFGEKVYQGEGPFDLQFRKYPPEEKHRTYLQIDGQFIRYTHPLRLSIRKSTLSQSSQIKVLRRVPLIEQKTCCGK